MRSILSKLFSNFLYKLIALSLGCSLWYIVQGKEILEINRRIAIQVQVPEGYTVKGDPVIYRYATLRGPRSVVGDFPDRDLQASIDITNKASRTHRIRLNREHLPEVPRDLSVTIHDAGLIVPVDKVETRTLPVKEVLKGTVNRDHMINEINVIPGRVSVTGPKSEISAVSALQTEPIDISGLNHNRVFTDVRIEKPSPFLDLSLEQVTIDVKLGDRKVNRRYAPIRVESEGTDYKTVIHPEFVSLVIQGTPGTLSQTDPSKDLRAFVQLQDLSPGRYEREVKVQIPPGVVLVETFPQYAVVEILDKKRVN